MFNHIMIPVDMHMPPEVQKATAVATEIAKWQGAKVTLVSVTGTQLGEVEQSDKTIANSLSALADEIGKQSGAEVETRNIHSVDVAAEVDGDLAKAAEEIGADLIVVGTHAPRITDYIFTSHAGKLAQHSKMSVFVVR